MGIYLSEFNISRSSLQKWALWLFFFSLNFEVWDPTKSGYFSIAKFTGLIYLISILYDTNSFLGLRYINKLLRPIWIFFILLTIINIININSTSHSFFDFTIFQNIFLFWLLFNHEKREPGVLEKGLLYFALGSFLLAGLYYFQIGIISTNGRVTIFGDNLNIIGIRMCISSIIMLLYIIKNSLYYSKWRLLLFVPILLMLAFMADTGSRVAFISLAVSYLIGILLLKSNTRSEKILFIFIAALIGILLSNYILHKGILSDRLMQTFQEGDLSSRGKIWESIFPLIKSNFVFGVGETGYVEYMISNYGKLPSPHNVVIEILAYTGILGLFIYLVYLFRIVKISYKYFHRTGHLLQLLLLVPIIGMLLSGQLLETKIGWVILSFASSKVIYLVDP